MAGDLPRLDEPVPVRAGEFFDLTKLNAYLTEASPSIGDVSEFKQFPGGYSNLTYLLVSSKGEFILRRPPFGAAIKSAHDMAREFKVLSLLSGHYDKIPSPIVYCDQLDVMGAPFYIMSRIQGVILRPSIVGSMKIRPDEIRAVSESLVDNLEDLHSINIQKTELIQLGKPEGYIKRQVDGWTSRYVAAQTETIPTVDAVAQWLSQHHPADGTPTLLHNDYKYDNVVLDQSRLSRIVGVLDWEMATVGDPWMDVGASLAYWAEERDGELARVFNVSWLPGNLTRSEVVERYSVRSGRSTLNPIFYYVFGLFKNAVIAQQIYARWKAGHSKDPRFGTLIHVIKDLGRRGSDALSTGKL